jgi:predicted dehydrogenase
MADLGRLMQPEDVVRMAEQRELDAVVSTAPPNLSNYIVDECMKRGIAVLVTKPVTLPWPIEAKKPVYVDYVRLWSPQYHRLKKVINLQDVRLIQICLINKGPFRDFSPFKDYGPHVFAFLFDLFGDVEFKVKTTDRYPAADGRGELLDLTGTMNGIEVEIGMGNGALERQCYVDVHTCNGKRLSYEETWKGIGFYDGTEEHISPPSALSNMIENFIVDVTSGHVNLHTAWLTMKGNQLLSEIGVK